MLIKVTQEDIYYDKRNNCKHCPVALAIKRATNDIRVFVGSDLIFFYYNNVPFQIGTPFNVAVWIYRFDRNLTVNPFEFELELEIDNAINT